MIQEIGANRYHNEYYPAVPSEQSRVLCYRGREIFVKYKEEQITFLTYGQVVEHFPALEGKATYLFAVDGVGYFLFRGQEGDAFSEQAEEAFPEFDWRKIELMRTAQPKELSFAGVTGMQLYGWYNGRRFCPHCGHAMEHSDRERMMRCPDCGQIEYPKISPAVIVGVTNGDRLLLTKYAGRAYTRYALIAGFAEIGETIEETVQREVMEEVGLRVKNIRYYKSQPWSFTDTLLMGFFAELDGDDDIRLDENELSVAEWHTREEIPGDDGVSLTREMMRVF
ncbi:MAG: NAD(+) diphosphatase, partial [Lachnospiraceae bacterium]|nr:NAD(+) diphosphatase [Lachnospiraceae bacterium]